MSFRHRCNPVLSAADDLYICLDCKRVYRRFFTGQGATFEQIPGERRERSQVVKPAGWCPDPGTFSKDKDRAIASRQVKDYWT